MAVNNEASMSKKKKRAPLSNLGNASVHQDDDCDKKEPMKNVTAMLDEVRFICI